MKQKINKLSSDCERRNVQCRGLPTAEKLEKCLEDLGGRPYIMYRGSMSVVTASGWRFVTG